MLTNMNFANKKKGETGYKKICTKEEVRKILKFIRKENYKAYVACKIMAVLGIRNGDVLSIRTEWVRGNMLHYNIRKTKKQSYKPIPEILKKDIARLHRKAVKQKKEFLFYTASSSNSKYSHIQTATIRWLFLQARRKANIDDYYHVCKNGKKLRRISPHTFRHYAASMFYELTNKDYVATSEFLDHTDFKSTIRYITPFVNQSEVLERVRL